MLRNRKLLLAALALIGVIVGAVLLYILNFSVLRENGGTNGHNNGVSFFFSFDENMQGWEARALDLELGNSTIDWSITQSRENVKNGSGSLRFYLDNKNDMGKIWIEKSFVVKPSTRYRVNVSYAFASADSGDLNFFTIITGVLKIPPNSRDELVYQGNTGNGAHSDVGHLWLEKSYSFSVESDATGKLFVIVGVWGVWETARTYYLENLKVVFAELAA